QHLVAMTKNGGMRLQIPFHRSVMIELWSAGRVIEGAQELGVGAGKKSARGRNTSRGSQPCIERDFYPRSLFLEFGDAFLLLIGRPSARARIPNVVIGEALSPSRCSRT